MRLTNESALRARARKLGYSIHKVAIAFDQRGQSRQICARQGRQQVSRSWRAL
jgi:hypothetical protein